MTSSPIPTEGGKHTPGPWFIECDGLPELRNVSTYITAGQFEDHVLICEVNTDAPDARLIAAAPALLEALKGIMPLAEIGAAAELARFERMHLPRDHSITASIGIDRVRAAISAALAALAKATGGEDGR